MSPITTNALGSNHWLGFKPQAASGTPEASVNTFLSTQSFSMNANLSVIERKSYNGTSRQLPGRAGWFKPAGKCVAEVMASQPHPWYWALGTTASSQPSSAAPSAYLSTITAPATGAPVRLTAEGYRVFDYAKQGDVYVDSIKLSGSPGEIGQMEIGWLGLSHSDAASATASTPAFVTDVLTVRAATVKIDGAQDFTVQDFETTYDNQLEQLPVIENASGAPRVIRRKEIAKVTGKLKFIDFPAAALVKLRNATTFALIVELVGDTISGAYYKYLRITLPACQYTGGLDPDISDSVITGDATFAGYYDTGTGNQILVESQSTIQNITT